MAATALWEKARASLSLSWTMARANFLLRNEGSYLGLVWYLLSPLATFAVILLVKEHSFSQIEIARYPAYLLVGILLHHFLAHVVGDAAGAIAANGGLLKSTRIPREALVVSRLLSACLSHALEVVALLAFTWGMLALVPGLALYLAAFALFAVFCLGLALAAATVGAYVGDLKNVWSAVAHLLFFVTPIFHAPAEGSPLYRLNLWNPLARFADVARAALVYGRLPTAADWAILAAWSAGALAIGAAAFWARKRRFAELV